MALSSSQSLATTPLCMELAWPWSSLRNSSAARSRRRLTAIYEAANEAAAVVATAQGLGGKVDPRGLAAAGEELDGCCARVRGL